MKMKFSKYRMVQNQIEAHYMPHISGRKCPLCVAFCTLYKITVESDSYLCLSDYVIVYDIEVDRDLNSGRCSAGYDTIQYFTCSNRISVINSGNNGIRTQLQVVKGSADILRPFSCTRNLRNYDEPIIPLSFRCEGKVKLQSVPDRLSNRRF